MIKLAITIGCLEIGGAEIFVLNLLKRLDYQKYRVLLIVLSKKYNTFLEDQLEKLPIKVLYLNKKEGFRPLTMIRITKILWRFSPDIMHGNVGGMVYLFLYLILFWKSKAIHTAHTLANIEYGFYKRKILAMFYRRKKVIPVAISPVIKKSIVETYHLSKDDVMLINNAVDVRRFETNRCYYDNSFVIGHIGRYELVKNHKTVIAVYRQLLQSYPHLQLRLVGDGSLFTSIKKEIANLKNVHMIKKTAQIEKQLAQIDIFLLPSVYEGMPLSLIEAMASGAVIVASRVGGIIDIIENGVNGYLVDDCYDIDSFVGIFHHLLENKDEMTEISKRNVEKAKAYDIGQLVLAYENLYTREASNANGRI